jgi:two-component system CheB/CheR fusion protein
MRILPYRTVENVIDGLVVTFTEVTEQKQTKARLRQALAFSENVVDTVHEALLVLDDELHVVSANRSFYQMFGVLPAETEGRLVYELGNRQWDIAELHRLLEEIVPQNTSIEAYEMEHEFAHMGRRLMRLNAHMMPANEDGRWLILLAIDDVTTE